MIRTISKDSPLLLAALNAVADAWGIPAEDVKRGASIGAQLARKCAFTLIRDNSSATWGQMGRWFGVSSKTVSTHGGRMSDAAAERPDIAQKIRRAEYLFCKSLNLRIPDEPVARHAIAEPFGIPVILPTPADAPPSILNRDRGMREWILLGRSRMDRVDPETLRKPAYEERVTDAVRLLASGMSPKAVSATCSARVFEAAMAMGMGRAA